MKIFLFPLIALGLISQTLALTNYRQCYNKSQYTIQAISRFCKKTDIVVPSTYARALMYSKIRNSAVNIEGNCRPAQWVPSSICLSQFHQMCARGDKWGTRTARWGRNKCQTWNIYAFSNGRVKGKNGKRDVEDGEEYENSDDEMVEE